MAQPPRVLLLGATGFIGRHLLAALADSGYQVTCGVRGRGSLRGCAPVTVDFMHDHAEIDWAPRVAGVDYVINAVGILRETAHASFAGLHVAAPAALFRASAAAGVRKVVQISALGADEGAQSAYHLSKKRADDVLATLAVPWVIVQPSLVFGMGGQSARLFTQLAALPRIPVPEKGAQRIQPIHIDDLTALVLRLLATSEHDGRRIAAVGPHPTTLRDFLAGLRLAMGLGTAKFLNVPMVWVRAAAALGDRLPGVLLDSESLGMLMRGNVAPADAVTAVLGSAPRPVEAFIEPESSHALATQARLAWLLPLMRIAIAIVWIVTGVVSLGVYPVADSYALLARVGLTGVLAAVALYGAALIDFAFGIGILVLRRRRWLWRAQMGLIVAYTVIISLYLPEFWLHPYGPLTKNLPMLAAIFMLHELEDSA